MKIFAMNWILSPKMRNFPVGTNGNYVPENCKNYLIHI